MRTQRNPITSLNIPSWKPIQTTSSTLTRPQERLSSSRTSGLWRSCRTSPDRRTAGGQFWSRPGIEALRPSAPQRSWTLTSPSRWDQAQGSMCVRWGNNTALNYYFFICVCEEYHITTMYSTLGYDANALIQESGVCVCIYSCFIVPWYNHSTSSCCVHYLQPFLVIFLSLFTEWAQRAHGRVSNAEPRESTESSWPGGRLHLCYGFGDCFDLHSSVLSQHKVQ